ISTEYTIDRATPQIRTWDYKLPGMAARFGAEAAASEWLAKISPQLFDDTKEQEKLTVDMTVFSLLAYFGNEMRDWQTDYRTYRGSIGILMTGQALSTDDECGKITEADLQRLLQQAGSVFNGATVLFGPYICFPPRTTVAMTQNSLVLENPFCRIEFAVALSGSLSNIEPGTGGQVPQAPQGGARYQ